VPLADEPTGNLDTQIAREIMQTLRWLNQKEGVTVVVVTWEPDIAGYCPRVSTKRGGATVSDQRQPAQTGTADARPATRRRRRHEAIS
jgi:putative ABC transport system ATP-binding protein